jgi:hypothetical protein
MRKRIVVLALGLASGIGASGVAQGHRPWLELGAGTLSPDDPFAATLAMRAGIGSGVGGRNAIGLDYSRQSANGSEGDDLGKFARHFIGVAWRRALGNAFDDQESMKQQYWLRIGGGMLVRGTFPEAVGDQQLKNATFLDVGLIIRYPFSSRVAAVGSIEDAVGFLPRESLRSYCTWQNGARLCYPRGGPTYYTVNHAADVQHNFGIFAVLQVRP